MNILKKQLLEDQLLDEATLIASFIEYNWRGNFELDLPRNRRDYYENPSDNHQYAVLNAAGKILFQSEGFYKSIVKTTLDFPGRHYFTFNDKNGESFYGIKYDYLFEDKIYPVYVIENEDIFSEFATSLTKDILENIFIVGFPLLLIQGILIILIFRFAIKPILRASKEAKNIKYNNLGYRMPEENMPQEILPLIQSFNQSLGRLESSIEEQKFFIANAAHELKTPITILKARISKLKNEKEIFMLNQDIRNINRLISQMLDVSRLDYAYSLKKQDVNLNKIVKQICQEMGPLFIDTKRNLSLSEDIKDQTVYGNEDVLYRAILNLVENTLKHTPEETSVSVIIREKHVIIRDYGPPIKEEHQQIIFNRFEKTPDGISRKGSGLGLAIVQKAAELHFGRIELKTRPDGNDFIFYLG